MPKTKRTRENVVAEARREARQEQQNGSESAVLAWAGGRTRQEVESLVCKFHCQAHNANEISSRLKARGIAISREQVYQVILKAASLGHLHYTPPLATALHAAVEKQYKWLKGVDIEHTATVDDVAQAGAKRLLRLIQQHARQQRDVVRVGLAGGHCMRKMVRQLAELLLQSQEGLPRQIVFHALVAGFDVDDPTTAPNAFFTYFVNEPSLQRLVRFVGLHAPAMVETADFESLKKTEGIDDAYQWRDALDVIVTSAAARGDEHSLYEKCMRRREKAYLKLCRREFRYEGDMIWRPLGEGGPIEEDLEIRAMSLIELSDLPGFIHRGKSVLLVLAPCGVCLEPKPVMLRTVLNQPRHLITHLVCDSQSARGLKLPIAG